MSAALQLPMIWRTQTGQCNGQLERGRGKAGRKASPRICQSGKGPESSRQLAWRFTGNTRRSCLRRYLYASMQVGRAPSILGEPIGRGWASSRPIRTFEDAVIFVLDVETCLNRLGSLDRRCLAESRSKNIPRLKQLVCWG